MRSLFARARRPAARLAGLGEEHVALRLAEGEAAPAGTERVVFDAAGRIRRLAQGARLQLAAGETALCFHPGPYLVEIAPCAAAPEIGLAVHVAVDAPDPRVVQQRFDLFLAAEVTGELALARLGAHIEKAVRHALELGNLDLPPCTSLDEWNAFRSGFNRLLYTRFGLSVDDCVPVDLGEKVDYAAMLRGRAQEGQQGELEAAPHAPPHASASSAPPASASARIDAVPADRQCLRRLFLELPGLMCALRMVTPGPGAFCLQRSLLQRLDLASLQAATMPALELAAPGAALGQVDMARRERASRRAAGALDEAWGALARSQEDSAALFDELDRIAANLETALAERRSVRLEEKTASRTRGLGEGTTG